MKHRSDEEMFVTTASILLKVREKYNLFLKTGHRRTNNFQTAYIDSIVRALKQIVRTFKYDMDKVVFRGLDEAMTEVDIIIGPHRNTMNVIVKRMVTNTELVSLHVGNFIQYDFKHDDLDDLVKTSIHDILIVEETLPRYYNIILDMPKTMKRLDFDYNAFSFTPQRLARQSEQCQNDVYFFTNDTRKIKRNLTSLLEKWQTWNSSTNDADVRIILKNLNVNLHKYETRFELLKENCFDNFTDAVQEIRKLNESHQEQVDIFTDIEYTFNFTEESYEIKTEEKSFEWFLVQFLDLGNITKRELEENLTEDGMDERITTVNNFINKVKFRLTERLRAGLDKTRDDITDWYKDVVVKAARMREFMSPNFLEERLSQMEIWKSPVVKLFQEDQLENTYLVNTTEWDLPDFVSPRSLQLIEDILLKTFDPINELLDDFDEELTDIEQDLSTALNQVKNLMITYRTQDEMDERFVLKNFLQMDIYFAEMRIQKIIEIEAYSLGDLFGD